MNFSIMTPGIEIYVNGELKWDLEERLEQALFNSAY